MQSWPNFLGLEGAACDPERAKVALLPCPFDGTSTYAKGADHGPFAILRASPQLEEYDDELDLQPLDDGIATLAPVEFDSTDPEVAVRRIEERALAESRAGRLLIGLGGEHTITVGLTRAARRIHGAFSVLQIDAHADLRDEYCGSRYNHACVMRRVAEDDPQSKLVAVGVRAFAEEEARFARHRGVHLFHARDVAGDAGDWVDEIVERLRSPVYVTFDLDGLDPALVPATGTPVPGGLGWWPTLRLLRAVGARHRVVAADVNELKPDPVHHHADMTAAALVSKMVAYFVSAHRA